MRFNLSNRGFKRAIKTALASTMAAVYPNVYLIDITPAQLDSQTVSASRSDLLPGSTDLSSADGVSAPCRALARGSCRGSNRRYR